MGGGAVNANNLQFLMITSSLFVLNEAQIGGALDIRYIGELSVKDNNFTSNSAYIAGAVYIILNDYQQQEGDDGTTDYEN